MCTWRTWYVVARILNSRYSLNVYILNTVYYQHSMLFRSYVSNLEHGVMYFLNPVFKNLSQVWDQSWNVVFIHRIIIYEWIQDRSQTWKRFINRGLSVICLCLSNKINANWENDVRLLLYNLLLLNSVIWYMMYKRATVNSIGYGSDSDSRKWNI